MNKKVLVFYRLLISIGESKFRREFSSPIGESIFSTAYIDIAKSDYKYVLVPYRGIYFLYRNLNNQSTAIQSSRPLSGNLFSLLGKDLLDSYTVKTVLVPYRGIYFLYTDAETEKLMSIIVLVPYRGIYFLYNSDAP